MFYDSDDSVANNGQDKEDSKEIRSKKNEKKTSKSNKKDTARISQETQKNKKAQKRSCQSKEKIDEIKKPYVRIPLKRSSSIPSELQNIFSSSINETNVINSQQSGKALIVF